MNTYQIILVLAERFGLIIGVIFLFMTIMPMERLHFVHRKSKLRTVLSVLIFGGFGILGTYTGNEVFNSVANLRAMVVVTGGLFGGPVVGIGAGLVAALHRILTDFHGFSAWPCGIATALEGLAAGLIAHRFDKKAMNWQVASSLALVGESVHMGLILCLSRPFPEAVELVKLIAPPMLLVNSFGAALFVEILNLFSRDRERRESLHAQLILDIANITVGYLRMGLNIQSAEATARLIRNRVGVPAVAITDTKNVLAHIGAGDDHHLPGHEIRTQATREVLTTGEPAVIHSAEEIGCEHHPCPLTSAVIVPLVKNGEILGTLKFYGTSRRPLNNTLYELAKGLGNLFSTQLELEDIQITEQMLAQAEIRRLQSQINPHFLFNSLNTITSFCRTNSEKARELLMDLSFYMRRNLDLSRNFIPLKEELGQVRSYLAIEKARFGQRINVDIQVDESCEDWPIPPLIIQPLVENSIRHGLLARKQGGNVLVRAVERDDHLEVTVADDGVGMAPEVLEPLLNTDVMEAARGGIGLRNSLSRIKHIYGPQYLPEVKSTPGKGTSIFLRIPRKKN